MRGAFSLTSGNIIFFFVEKYKLAFKNPLNLEASSPSKKHRRKKRHQKKINRLKAPGLGCPWSSDSVVFRVELFWENKLGEQANFSLHWISVRKIKGKERQKYVNYFNKNSSQLSPGETVELRYLLCYLDSYYQSNFYEKPENPQVNNAFIFPARKVGDGNIHQPIARRLWDKKTFLKIPLNSELLAVYNNTIWHQNQD